MYLYELYKDLYYKEMQERQYYDGKIVFTFTMLSASAGAIAFYVSKFKDGGIVIKGLIVVSIVIFVMQMILTFRAYFSWRYRYYDFPVNKIEESIKSYYGEEKYKKIEKEDILVFEWVLGMLSRTYAVCCSKYYEQNLIKRRAHHLLNLCSYINLCILLIIFLFMQVETFNLQGE